MKKAIKKLATVSETKKVSVSASDNSLLSCIMSNDWDGADSMLKKSEAGETIRLV